MSSASSCHRLQGLRLWALALRERGERLERDRAGLDIFYLVREIAARNDFSRRRSPALRRQTLPPTSRGRGDLFRTVFHPSLEPPGRVYEGGVKPRGEEVYTSNGKSEKNI